MSNTTNASLLRAPSAMPTLQRTMSISSEPMALARAPSAMPVSSVPVPTAPTLQRSATLMAPPALPPLIRTESYRPVGGLARTMTLGPATVLHPVAESYAPTQLDALKSIFSQLRNARAVLPGSRPVYSGSSTSGGDCGDSTCGGGGTWEDDDRCYGGGSCGGADGPEEELAQK